MWTQKTIAPAHPFTLIRPIGVPSVRVRLPFNNVVYIIRLKSGVRGQNEQALTIISRVKRILRVPHNTDNDAC